MQIAIPMYDRFTALDAVGPYEVLSRLPGAQVTWLAHEPGLVRTDNHMLAIEATAAFEDLPEPDVIVVPGGTGTRDLLDDDRILDGLRATSHWLELETLAEYGAEPTGERVVAQGKVVTAAGVSSGIDMGLWLAGQIAGDDFARAVQLLIEYDPQPPYDAGSTEKAGPELTEFVRQAAASFR